jgi:hypothetical protein
MPEHPTTPDVPSHVFHCEDCDSHLTTRYRLEVCPVCHLEKAVKTPALRAVPAPPVAVPAADVEIMEDGSIPVPDDRPMARITLEEFKHYIDARRRYVERNGRPDRGVTTLLRKVAAMLESRL